MTLFQWMNELRRIMKENGFTDKALATVDARDWLDYYRSGSTPEEAFREDMSYA